MCGIAGLFRPTESFRDREGALRVLQNMLDVLAHRGPDADGIWLDSRDRCFLGHKRLSVIDVSDAGRQPMTHDDGRYIISYNGEIYNFRELKAELEALGIRVQSRTDTAVLLECIKLWGAEALTRLDGMFAFAVFDCASGELFLARDAFGEKPLYYAALPGGALAFASELRSFEEIPALDRSVSINGIGEYLTFQYINAPRTIYSKVYKLPPGHWLRLGGNGSQEIGRYFEFKPRASHFESRPAADLADELEDILIRGIERRLISDVPLGAFLSGGIDSSAICALICKKLNRTLKTFSVGFERYSGSEHLVANAIAHHLGTEHHQLMLRSDSGEFIDVAGRLLDEPNGDSSCAAVYQLAKLARGHVTVALSGDGGDEMFLGYDRYFSFFSDRTFRRRQEEKRMSVGERYLNRIRVGSDAMLRGLFGDAPEFASSILRALTDDIDRSSEPLACTLRQNDVETYLPGAVLAKVDRMSMQHSLEVRTPFLSIELARFCERLPSYALHNGPCGKIILREVVRRYLPESIAGAPKRGFGLPLTVWGQQELLSSARATLGSQESKLRNLFGPRSMDEFLAIQRGGERGLFYYQLWEMVVLESWLSHRDLDLPSLH